MSRPASGYALRDIAGQCPVLSRCPVFGARRRCQPVWHWRVGSAGTAPCIAGKGVRNDPADDLGGMLAPPNVCRTRCNLLRRTEHSAAFLKRVGKEYPQPRVMEGRRRPAAEGDPLLEVFAGESEARLHRGCLSLWKSELVN